MTCKEKMKTLYPRMDYGDLNRLFKEYCPEQFFGLEEPVYCVGEGDGCDTCWEREIPEETKEKPMIESIEHNCNDCVHQDVCKHMNEFLAAKQTLVDACAYVGNKTSIKLLDIPCVKTVSLQCKFYRKEVTTR